MSEKALEQVIEAVRQASPTMWAAAQQKVAADLAIAQMVIWLCFGLLVCGVIAVAVGAWRSDDWRMWPDVAFIAGVVAIVFAVVFIVAASIEIKQIQMAPDWYAIKALTDLSPLKGR